MSRCNVVVEGRVRHPSRAALVACVTSLLVLTSTGRSYAVPSSTAPAPVAASSPAPREASRWYGWQIAFTDAASAGLVVAFSSIPRDQNALLYLAAATYLGGGPTVHVVHGRWLTAAASLGLRGAVPLAGGLLGAALGPSDRKGRAACADCDDGWSGAGWFLGGATVGVAAACLIDIAILAHESVAVDTKDADGGPIERAPRSTRGSVAPTASFTDGGGVVGLRGVF